MEKSRKKFNRLIAVMVAVMITVLSAASIPAYAFSKNESRSIENFFIESALLKGDGSGYGFDRTPTRMEGVIILIRLLGKEAEAQKMQSLPCQFRDVPAWAAGYANYAFAGNISNGVSDTLFGTDDLMTAQQFNTLLLRTIGYDDGLGDFRWDQAIDKAYDLEILPGALADRYEKRAVYTKRDLMETAFCYLEAEYKGGGGTTLIGSLVDSGVIPKELAHRYGLDIEQWYHITTNFSEEEYAVFELHDNKLYISGNTSDENKKFILAMAKNKETGADKTDTVRAVGPDGAYDLTLSLGTLPRGEYYIDLYSNDERYHYYTSFVLSSIVVKVAEDGIYFVPSPVYGQNLRMYKGNKAEAQDGLMTLATRSDRRSVEAVTALAAEITAGSDSEYEKIRAIHDWVAGNIYYDRDFFSGKTETTNINSIDVLKNRYAVCSGYSNLTKDLLAAAGIQCKQVVGFALGITTEGGWENVNPAKVSPNHVWNEAFVDGRWIIIDSTWDSNNEYEGGTFTEGEGISRLYFDATVEYLSNTHMLTDYDM